MIASERIPPLAQGKVSERARQLLDKAERFVDEECVPSEATFEEQLGNGHTRWKTPQVLEDLKIRAKELGLWNMFLSDHYQEGAGLTNLEYGLIAEQLGRSKLAPEATNCSAPDTGNMELLAKYGSDEQKKKWLEPLLRGEIRSAYVMTEPDTASSDATNIAMAMTHDGDGFVLNGSKWWISSAGDPRCKFYIVIAKSDPNHPDKYKRHSMAIVPAGSQGVKVQRMLTVYGYDDAPFGHGHLTFQNVRVPSADVILGPGRGFEIMQGRMGPGRIHHAMRCIGSAERALDWMLGHANDPRKRPFGKLLSEQSLFVQGIALSRIEIDAARLVVLNAAIQVDETHAKAALKEIAAAKVLAPQVTGRVIDRAVQAFGAEGVSQDTPLAAMWANARIVRIADGPDEVHLLQLGRKENQRGRELLQSRKVQEHREDAILARYDIVDPQIHWRGARGKGSKL